MLRLFVALLVSFVLVCVTGCETFKGVGRDVQKGGEKIENEATR